MSQARVHVAAPEDAPRPSSLPPESVTTPVVALERSASAASAPPLAGDTASAATTPSRLSGVLLSTAPVAVLSDTTRTEVVVPCALCWLHSA